MRVWLLLAGLACSLAGWAVEIRQFESPEKQARYENLVRELRCLVCQNQSLADSDADLAKDLRDEVYQIIQSGKDEKEAAQFLVDRYGDFVLYRPPIKPATFLLWSGPFVLLAGGSLFLWRQSKRKSVSGGEEPGLSDEERRRLAQLKSKIEG
jgi:cytochrome c-type biogenesis protein CcmH